MADGSGVTAERGAAVASGVAADAKVGGAGEEVGGDAEAVAAAAAADEAGGVMVVLVVVGGCCCVLRSCIGRSGCMIFAVAFVGVRRVRGVAMEKWRSKWWAPGLQSGAGWTHHEQVAESNDTRTGTVLLFVLCSHNVLYCTV